MPVTLQDKTTTRMMMVGESCPVKACLSYIVGGAMGAFMGLFQVATIHKYLKQRPGNKLLPFSPALPPTTQPIK